VHESIKNFVGELKSSSFLWSFLDTSSTLLVYRVTTGELNKIAPAKETTIKQKRKFNNKLPTKRLTK
jgi:hypothetical protein